MDFAYKIVLYNSMQTELAGHFTILTIYKNYNKGDVTKETNRTAKFKITKNKFFKSS